MSRLTGKEAFGLMEAYQQVYAPRELTEEQVWEGVENWVNSLLEEGYDLSDYTWEDMYESYLTESQALVAPALGYGAAAATPYVLPALGAAAALIKNNNKTNKMVTTPDEERFLKTGSFDKGKERIDPVVAQNVFPTSKERRRERREKAAAEKVAAEKAAAEKAAAEEKKEAETKKKEEKNIIGKITRGLGFKEKPATPAPAQQPPATPAPAQQPPANPTPATPTPATPTPTPANLTNQRIVNATRQRRIDRSQSLTRAEAAAQRAADRQAAAQKAAADKAAADRQASRLATAKDLLSKKAADRQASAATQKAAASGQPSGTPQRQQGWPSLGIIDTASKVGQALTPGPKVKFAAKYGGLPIFTAATSGALAGDISNLSSNKSSDLRKISGWVQGGLGNVAQATGHIRNKLGSESGNTQIAQGEWWKQQGDKTQADNERKRSGQPPATPTPPTPPTTPSWLKKNGK